MGVVLITGCAGFIGSRICQSLLREGRSVVGVDNLNDSCDPILKRWRLNEIEKTGGDFQFHRLDIRDQAIGKLFHPEAPSAVLNLAARAGVRQSVDHPDAFFETNLMGTLNLLRLSAEFGVSKFVLASSSSVYGDSPPPFREDLPTDRPLSPYAASKKAAETLCFAYHRMYGLDVTMFRYFTVYGPAGRPDMSPFRFVQRIAEGRPVTVFGDGRQTRDFTHVDDIARGSVLGLKEVGCEAFNLGGDSPVSMLEFIGLIEELTGRRARVEFQPRHAADSPATRACIDKARDVLGWRPRVALREGMKELVDWYAANREWAARVES